MIVDKAYLYEEVNRTILNKGLYKSIEFCFFCSGKDSKLEAEEDSEDRPKLKHINLENVSPLFYKGFDVFPALQADISRSSCKRNPMHQYSFRL